MLRTKSGPYKLRSDDKLGDNYYKKEIISPAIDHILHQIKQIIPKVVWLRFDARPVIM